MATKYCGTELVTVSTDNVSSCLNGPCETSCNDTCGCTPSNPGCPTPFYDEAPAVQQANCGVSYISNFYSSIKSSTAWNIPACGATAVLRFGCIKAILVGSNLWNGLYGYFEVTAYNAETGDVTIKNNCVSGNAAPGTSVPACSEFVVAPPPCCTGGTELPYPYLKSNFVAPAVSGCLDIIVTSVNGLAVGKDVQIGSGVYRINGISGANLINICNDGEGITPGTSVIAQNDAGDYQYPLILIDVNPCNNPLISSGLVLACDAGITAPLTGLAAGSVLVLTDPVTGEAEYQVTGQPTFTCTILSQSLTLSTGVAGYTLTVADSSQFVPTDVIQIGSRTDRLTVTSIPDATHIIGTLAPVPGSIQLIPAGTSVCLIGCCETIQGEVDVLDSRVDALESSVSDLLLFRDLAVPANKIGTLTTDGASLVSNTASIAIVNTSGHIMGAMIAIDVDLRGQLTGANADPTNIVLRVLIDKNSAGFVPRGEISIPVFTKTDTAFDFNNKITYVSSVVVPIGTTDVYTVEGVVQIFCAGSTSSYNITTLSPQICVLGVSV